MLKSSRSIFELVNRLLKIPKIIWPWSQYFMFNKRQHQVLLSSEQVVVQKNLNYPASIKEIMHTWILQMNYPVVTVTIPQNGTVRATQQRFLRNPEAKDPLVYISPFGYGLLFFLSNIIAYYLIMISMYPNNVKYMTFSRTILR